MAGCSPGPVDVRSESNEQGLASDTLVSDTPFYAGFWRNGGGDQELRLALHHDDFFAEYEDLEARGYRLVSLSSNLVDGQVQYSGVFDAGTVAQELVLNRDQDDFRDEFLARIPRDYVLKAMTGVVVNGVVKWSGVWQRGTRGQALGFGMTAEQFLSNHSWHRSNGYVLTGLVASPIGGQARYAGLWSPGTVEQVVIFGKGRAAFEQEIIDRKPAGYRLQGMSSHVINDELFYSGFLDRSYAVQVVQYGVRESAFLAQARLQYQLNRFRVAALHTVRVEALALSRIVNQLHAKFSNPVAANGLAVTVAHGQTRARATFGQHRNPVNDPALAASTSTRFNQASVSKTVTAIAVLLLLRDKQLTPDSLVHPYLPADWTRGPNIQTITFRELLNHKSGFRAGLTESTVDLQETIRRGVTLADKAEQRYDNKNFAIFRIIIPYLAGFTDPGPAGRPAALSAAYLAFVNQRVLAPVGVAATSLRPLDQHPGLSYAFPAEQSGGTDWGDWTDTGAGAGIHLSTDELATLLVGLDRGDILPLDWVDRMERDYLGWGGTPGVPPRSTHGTVLEHGGFLWGNSVMNGQIHINTLIMNFSNGTQLSMIINSRTGVRLLDEALKAYDGSWIIAR